MQTRLLGGLASCTALFLLSVGCGGAAASGGGTTTSARGLDPCPTRGEVRLGRLCWNPIGSRWHVTALAPGGEYAFDVELLPANRLRSTDHPAGGPANDEWYVDGNTVRLFLSNRFVEYRADISNGTVVIGEALNVRGETWPWRGDRMQAAGECQPDEAALGETCFSAAGTRWTVHDEGTEFVVVLDANGVLLSERPEESAGNDRWEQHGADLTLLFDGGALTYRASLADPSRLSGTASQGSRTWQWSADRLDLYPPPMH